MLKCIILFDESANCRDWQAEMKWISLTATLIQNLIEKHVELVSF